MKKKEMSNQDKHALVQECIDAIGEKYTELCFKHDGCRILQSLVKFGNRPQRILVVDKLKDQYATLMQQKYSHYLASKLYLYAPLDSQKEFFRKSLASQMNKLVMHAYASEVVEYIYTQCQSDKEKREMVFALYGNYQLVLDEVFSGSDSVTLGQQNALRVFMQKKPQIASNILTKMESMVQKLIEKGNQRHTYVQAILLDYVECQAAEDLAKVRQVADLAKEVLPSLLASKEGLRVACALFNLLEAKDRKVVMKSLPVSEMATNRIAHLFLIHVANNLDDTQLTKKKLMHDVMLKIDDNIDDNSFRNVLNSTLFPLEVEKSASDGQLQYKRNSYISGEELWSMSLLLKKSTSKKDRTVRAAELFKIVQKPLEMFFEERLSFYLLDTKPNSLLKNLFVGLASQGEAGQSDLVDEMVRQVQKPYEEAQGVKQLLLGHPVVHRMLKDMIKGEAAAALNKKQSDNEEGDKPKKLKFASTMAKVVLKNFEGAIRGRGVFILLELVENEATKHLVSKQLKAQKKELKDFAKKDPKAKGL